MQTLRKLAAFIALRLIAAHLAATVIEIKKQVLLYLDAGHTRIKIETLRESFSGLDVAPIITRYCPELVLVGQYVTTREFYAAEQIIAERLTTVGSKLKRIPVSVLLEFFKRNHPNLSDSQMSAAISAINSPFSLIIGGPGTGKTTTLKAILDALQTFGYSVSLAAPTGRAAERMTEATGFFAQTIHRLLYYSPAQNKWFKTLLGIRRDALAVDEFSMMDTVLTAKLLTSASPYTRIIGLGDEEQIPSIGAGSVLRDLIASGAVNVARLTEVRRQAADSGIVKLTSDMKHGKNIDWVKPGDARSDVYFIHAPNDYAIAASIAKAVKSLPSRLGYTANTDIQVLTTIHKGVAGTDNLNAVIRKALLGEAAAQPFAVGDRVLHTKNNKRKRISNGNVGIVTEVTPGFIKVKYPRKSLSYTTPEQAELTHAHAMSVYKAQGSEFPVTIIPISDSQVRYWNRALLLTAQSRPQQLLIFVGNEKAYAQAWADTSPYERVTGLVEATRATGK